MKKLCSLLTSTLMITATPLLTNYGDNYSNTCKAVQDDNPNYPSNAEIIDFDTLLREAVFYNYLYDYPWTHPSYITMNTTLKDLTRNNVTTSPDGDPSTKNLPYGIYFGNATLANNTGTEQTFTLPSYTKTVKSEYSTEVKIGITDSVNFSFDYGNETFTGNLDCDTKVTNSVQTTLQSPTQSVKVEPHQTVKAYVYLGLSVGNLDINVSEDISGTVSANVHDSKTGATWPWTTTVGKAFAAMAAYHTLPTSIKILDNNTVKFTGVVTLSANAYNSIYSVKYEYIKNNNE